MKITVYNIKGSTGKTPIATNIALDHDYAIATNETYHILSDIFPEERVMEVSPNEEFPKLPEGIDIVFDLGGFVESGGASIGSALAQSDCVIIPVNNELKALRNTLHTIDEVRKINSNIIIVATKLERRDKVTGQWEKGADFLNIKKIISEVAGDFPTYPLKLSKAFESIFEEEKSIKQIIEKGGLLAYSYREVNEQFDEIYKHLSTNYGK